METRATRTPRNALTIDVEDWRQLAYRHATGKYMPPSQHVVAEVQAILFALERNSITATFFVLAEVARRFPAMIAEISAAGHEIGCHGWAHEPVHRQTPDVFRDETLRARDVLEDIIGQPVRGYRAAYFSISTRCAWAWEILKEAGFLYDSSTVANELQVAEVSRVAVQDLVEVPVTTVRWASTRIPIGGGYLHMLPYRVVADAIRAVNMISGCAIVYFHPYDWPTRPLRLPGCSFWNRSVTTMRFPHALGRRKAQETVERLLRDFTFGSILSLYGESAPDASD